MALPTNIDLKDKSHAAVHHKKGKPPKSKSTHPLVSCWQRHQPWNVFESFQLRSWAGYQWWRYEQAPVLLIMNLFMQVWRQCVCCLGCIKAKNHAIAKWACDCTSSLHASLLRKYSIQQQDHLSSNIDNKALSCRHSTQRSNEAVYRTRPHSLTTQTKPMLRKV